MSVDIIILFLFNLDSNIAGSKYPTLFPIPVGASIQATFVTLLLIVSLIVLVNSY